MDVAPREAFGQQAGPDLRAAFDQHHPPDKQLIDDCVHCGFCLPTCPTYLLWGEEMDSPRGRIYLMDIGLEGEPLDDGMASHFDRCLGCMACVTSCPSGVQYDKLIEATRQQVERRYPRSRGDRALRALIFALFPHPGRLRALRGPLGLYRRTGLQRLVRRSGPSSEPSSPRSTRPRRGCSPPRAARWSPRLGSAVAARSARTRGARPRRRRTPAP